MIDVVGNGVCLLGEADVPTTPGECEPLLEALQAVLAALDDRIAQLAGRRGHLVALIDDVRARTRG
ncbi:hypothetical protein [Allokutzneria oryzae]|uniref:Uncharacterized protein n=1 Tax=Allokutzneria oryzae TaxID=1378989 RepID=A0ABV6A5N5_9PSEU